MGFEQVLTRSCLGSERYVIVQSFLNFSLHSRSYMYVLILILCLQFKTISMLTTLLFVLTLTVL